jgi:hypothetical protein
MKRKTQIKIIAGIFLFCFVLWHGWYLFSLPDELKSPELFDQNDFGESSELSATHSTEPALTTDVQSTDIQPQTGETKRFEFGEQADHMLILEVTNVASQKTGTANDGEIMWEYEIYELYPGATLTVINADMIEGNLTEDGQPHAEWHITDGTGNYENNTPITNDMEPIALTKDMRGIAGEGVYVLGFEWILQNAAN